MRNSGTSMDDGDIIDSSSSLTTVNGIVACSHWSSSNWTGFLWWILIASISSIISVAAGVSALIVSGSLVGVLTLVIILTVIVVIFLLTWSWPWLVMMLNIGRGLRIAGEVMMVMDFTTGASLI